MTEMAQLRVIVCDDDINIRSYMTAMLKAIGVSVVLEAETGDVVGELLATQAPIHGIFQDLVLQKDSGLEIGRLCKAHGVPVVFCSASNDEFNVNQMLDIGWVLVKPVRLGGLKRAVEHFQCSIQRCTREDCKERT